MQKTIVLGLMSGTSMDGLDCGLFEIILTSNYKLDWTCIDFQTFPYSAGIIDSIRTSLQGNTEVMQATDRKLGMEFAILAEKFIKYRQIDLIATHGQTIAHNDGISTQQIGDPKYLQQKMQVPVVYNFRQADIDVGGNGAPLMPFLDWLLFQDNCHDTITLNLGGVANISFIPKSGKRNEVIGFDTGPGMALIDECCEKFYNEPIDMDGVHAKQGKVNEDILSELMEHKFIQKMPPKSTGRHEFGEELLKGIFKNYSQTSPDDMIRTFCIYTAKSIAENLNKFLNFNTADIHLIISGGGVHHPVLMEDIQRYTEISDLQTADVLEMEPDMKEALLIAVIGVARMQEMIANIPTVTGANKMVMLGDLVQY